MVMLNARDVRPNSSRASKRHPARRRTSESYSNPCGPLHTWQMHSEYHERACLARSLVGRNGIEFARNRDSHSSP